MSELRKAAQQALEALENDVTQRTYAGGVRVCNAAIALRAALAQPEREPASASAWWTLVMGAAAALEDASICLRDEDAKRRAISGAKYYRDAAKALWAAPSQRKPLTEEEIDLVCAPLGFAQMCPREVARAIEKAHGIGEWWPVFHRAEADSEGGEV